MAGMAEGGRRELLRHALHGGLLLSMLPGVISGVPCRSPADGRMTPQKQTRCYRRGEEYLAYSWPLAVYVVVDAIRTKHQAQD
jgi:hypothetical protein